MFEFLFGIACGLFTNGIALTTELKNFDCILFANNHQTLGVSLRQGRYILHLVQVFLDSTHMQDQVYYYNIIITLVLVSACAVLITKILNFKNRIFSFLFVGIFTSFVAISSMIYYNFAAPMYSIAMFLSIYATKVWYETFCSSNAEIKKNLSKYLFVMLLLIISLGIYQAYILITMALVNILFIIHMLRDDNKDFKTALKGFITAVVIILLSYIVNSLISKAFLSYYGETFDQGVTRGVSGFLSAIFSSLSPTNIFSAYSDMILLFYAPYGYAGVINNNILIYAVYFISLFMSIILFFVLFINSHKEMSRKICAILAFILLPLTFGLLEVVFPSMVDSLQLQNLTLYIGMPLFLFNALEKQDTYLSKIFKKVIVASSVVCILCYAYFSNVNLKDLSNMNKVIDKELDTLITRISCIDGYSVDKPVIFIGNQFYAFRNIVRTEIFPYRGVNMNNFGSSDDLEFMLKNYSGYRYASLNTAAAEATIVKSMIKDTDEVKAMGFYPASNSIRVIDDYIVVRLPD